MSVDVFETIEFAKANGLATPAPKTLRDEYAMAALTGLVIVNEPADPETVAEAAYRYADAMMAVRFIAEDDPLRRDWRGVTQGMRDYLRNRK